MKDGYKLVYLIPMYKFMYKYSFENILKNHE